MSDVAMYILAPNTAVLHLEFTPRRVIMTLKEL